MRKLAATTALVFALASSPASAHIPNGLNPWPSIKRQRQLRIVELTHKSFNNKHRAHWAVRVFDCESQLRWWLKGSTYWGMPQGDENWRNSYSPGWDEGGWSIKEQVVATKNAFNSVGESSWPNCP